MFKVGEFSKLSQVSVKTLRYYDELGLLKPSQVDKFTSYRYYRANQLLRLNRILALKDLGFPLEQLAQIVDEQVTPEQIQGMLQLRQAELQQYIETEQARLARVQARLHQLEQEKEMSTHDVVMKKVEPQTVVAIRRVLPSYSHIGELFEELMEQLGNMRPAGPPLMVCYDEEYRESNVDVEVAMPVQASSWEMPGKTMMASITFWGLMANRL